MTEEKYFVICKCGNEMFWVRRYKSDKGTIYNKYRCACKNSVSIYEAIE